MNIENVNLSSLASSSTAVASVPPPLDDGAVIPVVFSGALITQIELLNAINTGNSDQVGLPEEKLATQDFAALLGNDLPPLSKINDDVDHQAALAAVTDTLNYMSTGAAAGEHAAETEQGAKDAVAIIAPAQQNKNKVQAPIVPAEQNTPDMMVQSNQDTIDQSNKNAPVMELTVQTDVDQEKKKPVESQVEPTGVIENSVADGEAAIILPALMPVAQAKVANNLALGDAIKEGGSLSFAKPSAGGNQLRQAPQVALQAAVIIGHSVQDKQDANVKYFEHAGSVGNTGRIESQALNLEEDKTWPRVAIDLSPLNRMVVDNKPDVPAMTKPLAHPEWSKDLGERIVWMSSRAIPAAEIRLNPQHLGPISVRVDVTDDKATVVFTAQHAAAKEAIEASIPKLREMMGAQQLNLVEVNVSQGSGSDQGRTPAQNFAQTAQDQRQGTDDIAGIGVDDVEQEIDSGRVQVSKGLLSIYA